MSTPNFVELDAFVNNRIIPKTTDVVYLNSPVFTRLQSRNAMDFRGGLQIRRPIMFAKLNGGFIGRGDGMDVSFVTTDAAIVENMTLAYVAIAVYGFDAMANDGETAIFNQVELKFLNASMKMVELLATNMYLDNNGARSKYLAGLPKWIDDGNQYTAVGGQTRANLQATGTVGGLNAYTATLSSFQLQAVQLAYGASWFGADHVDLIVATQNGWNFMWNATQPLQRYNEQAAASDVAKMGFMTMRFNAAEVVVDKYMPTGSQGVMYGLNTKYLEWYFSTNPMFQFGWTGFDKAPGSLDIVGHYLAGSQMILPNPRSSFKLKSTQF